MTDTPALTHDEKILWIMNLLNCVDTNQYYAVQERLYPLSMDELDALDTYASPSTQRAQWLHKALISESPMEDIFLALPLVISYAEYHDFESVLEVISELRKRGLGVKNARVHVVASIRCVFISHSGMSMSESAYTKIPGMMELIEEQPERMVEITDLRVRRKTNDVSLIREALNTAKPLAEGAL